jgi:hypothetical protein
VAKANYQIKELKTQLESKTQVFYLSRTALLSLPNYISKEYEIMMSEVDNISKSYEDMQAQSKRLLNDMKEKEDVIIQVGSEVSYFVLSFPPPYLYLILMYLIGNAREATTCHGKYGGTGYAGQVGAH